jgi:CSLREA domain-containing protein
MNGPENITANFAPIPGYVVTTLADDPPGTAANCPIANTPPSSSCTLRDAITAADANNGGEGNITFASGLTGTIDLTSVTPTALPTLRGQISITGPGANVVTVSGNNSATVGSIFAVYIGATVGISGLTIANGSAYIGGAINNSGTLTLANNTFSGNSVGTYGSGGAIVSSGTLTVGDSTFSGNHAGNDGSGGAISSSNTLKVTNSTFSGNYTGNDGSGGAIGSTGTLTVNDSTFSGNYAGSSGNGGAIDSAYTTTVNNSIFSGNYVGTGGLGGGITGGAATNVSNSVFYNNVDTLGTDVDNCNGCSSNNNEVTGNPNLAAPGNYGGPTQTMIPLPGSSAICAGSSGLIPAGITTDQRGFPNTNTSYGFTPSPCVDAGAVQTNYSLGFTTEPTGVSVATDFAAAVTLNESGNPFQPGVTIPLTLTGSGTLTGGSATTSAGVASYTLQVDTVGSSDTLTANLTLNSALDPAVAISATSNAFGVGMTTPTVGLDYSTSGSIGYGTPETFYAYLPPGATGTVTFYNNGSTPLNSVPAPVSGGTATFSSSTLAVGSYSITAAYSGDSNYNPNTSSALSLTVYPSPATMASPTPSSALTSAATTFTWNTVSGSVTYGLNVGTTGVGSADLVNIGPLSGPSVTVNLPTNGTMIYVRLWTIYNGTGYLYNDYTYTEFTQSPAAITSPAPGTTLTTAATTFTWSPGPVGTTSYGLNIGTTGVGSADLVNIGPLPLAPPSVTVNLPTNGTTIYVRLWTIVNGTTYLANDYTYTEFTQSPAVITSPAPGTTLTSAATTFTWSAGPAGTTGYGLNIGTTGVGSADLVNIYPVSGTSVTVNLPTNGTMIYVRLWTVLNGTTFLYNDYTYTEFTQSPAAITSPMPGSTLTSAATTFTWSAGPAGTTGYGLNVGTTGVGSADLVNIGPLPLSPTSVTVNLPTNGTPIYVRLWTILNGTTYLYNDYTYTEFTQ